MAVCSSPVSTHCVRDSKMLTVRMVIHADGCGFIVETEIVEGGKVHFFTLSAFVHESFLKASSPA